jgi:protein-arginine kinase activator protein McsA
MTNEECERIAELVFQKMLAQQKEWDSQNIVQEIVRLNLLKSGYIDREEYLKAAKVQVQIDDLKSNIKKD